MSPNNCRSVHLTPQVHLYHTPERVQRASYISAPNKHHQIPGIRRLFPSISTITPPFCRECKTTFSPLPKYSNFRNAAPKIHGEDIIATTTTTTTTTYLFLYLFLKPHSDAPQHPPDYLPSKNPSLIPARPPVPTYPPQAVLICSLSTGSFHTPRQTPGNSTGLAGITGRKKTPDPIHRALRHGPSLWRSGIPGWKNLCGEGTLTY